MGGPLDVYDFSGERSGLSSGALATVAPTLEQTWDAARQQTRAIGQTNSTSYYEQPFYDDLDAKLNQAGYRYRSSSGFAGASVSMPFGSRNDSAIYDQLGYKGYNAHDAEDQRWAAVEDAHTRGLLKDVPTREVYEKSVGTRMAADNAQAGDVLSRARGMWGTAAQFLGSAWQGMHDPAQVGLIAASEGVGAIAGKLATAGGTAGRIAAFVAPRATGAGMTSAGAITRATLGSMAREGTVFAAGNAALLPALHANEDQAGVAHNTAGDLEQVGQGFLMGAGLGAVGTVAGAAARSIMGRLYPNMPPEMRGYLDGRASEAGTAPMRDDLAGAAEGAAVSPAVTPGEQDSIRHGASSAIDAEINPYLGPQGAETHGAMLAANRSAMTVGVNTPPVVPSSFAAQANPIGAFVSRLGAVESGGNDAARAATSSATGRYQFTDKTWMRYYRQAFPGDDASEAAILARRTHGGVQDRVMAVAAQNYANVLRDAGQPVTPGNLYLVHFAGEGGARKLFSAHSDASARAVLGDAAVHANPFLEGMKASDVIAWADRRMVGSRGERAPLPWDGANAADALADDGGVAAAQARVSAAEAEQMQVGAQADADVPPPIEAPPPAVPMPAINPDRVGEHVPDMPALNAPDDRPIYPRMVDTRDLQRSPDFQFRGEAAPDAQPSAHPGAIDVFERNDGSRVIVDGHARVAAAEADGPALMQAHIMREADGWTLPEMQAAAIVRNLIEGGVSDADRARIYEANPKLARMIEGDGYGKGKGESAGGIADTGGDAGSGGGAGPVAGAGERGGAGAPGDAGRTGATERSGVIARAEPAELSSAQAFSDPAGAGASAQAEQLGHDWLQKPAAAEGGEAPPPPPDAVMPDLKALKAEDAFAVNGASLQSIRDVTREIERTDAALAELRACL